MSQQSKGLNPQGTLNALTHSQLKLNQLKAFKPLKLGGSSIPPTNTSPKRPEDKSNSKSNSETLDLPLIKNSKTHSDARATKLDENLFDYTWYHSNNEDQKKVNVSKLIADSLSKQEEQALH